MVLLSRVAMEGCSCKTMLQIRWRRNLSCGKFLEASADAMFSFRFHERHANNPLQHGQHTTAESRAKQPAYYRQLTLNSFSQASKANTRLRRHAQTLQDDLIFFGNRTVACNEFGVSHPHTCDCTLEFLSWCTLPVLLMCGCFDTCGKGGTS